MRKVIIFIILFALVFQPEASPRKPAAAQENQPKETETLKTQASPENSSASLAGGYALQFDGVGDYVSVPNNTSLNPAQITVGLWAKSAGPTWNNTSSLLSKRDAYIIHPESGSKNLKFFIFVDGWVSATFTAPAGFDIAKWHHYAGTFDGANIQIYVDGELMGETLKAGSIKTNDTGPLYIGKDDGSERYFSGMIDDVRIWDRALEQSEIQASIYSPGAYPNHLKASWQFNEGSGSTAVDSSGNNNTGTLVNSPAWESIFAISGRVTDPDGSGIGGVTIRVVPERTFLPMVMTGRSQSQASSLPSQPIILSESTPVVTDSKGYYTFPDLTKGRFIVTAELEGIPFTPASQVVVLPNMGIANFQVEMIEPKIPETTEVLTDATDQYMQSVSPDGSVITFSHSTPELQELGPGDILVNDGSTAAPNGLLRKVTNVSNQGGGVVVTTEPAALEEAVEDGALYGSEQLTPADIASTTALQGVQLITPTGPDSIHFQYNLPGELTEGDVTVKTVGSIEFDVDFEFYLKIKNWQVKQITAANTTTITDTLEISSEVEAAEFNKEFLIAQHVFKPIVKMIGYVPVVIVPSLDVIIGMNGDVKVGISTSVIHTFTMRAGISYQVGPGWNTFAQISNRFDPYKPPHPTLNARVKGYVGARLNYYLYRAAGPYVSVQPYLEIVIQRPEDPWWKLQAGVDIPMGFRVYDKLNKILKVEEVKFTEFTIPDPPKLIAQAESQDKAPNAPEIVGPANGSIDQVPSVDLSWTGSDPDMDELNYDVYLGITNPPPLVSRSQDATIFDPVILKPLTEYYWQVVAWDKHGLSKAGPVWNFTTGNINLNEMVLIPAGEFQMGSDSDNSRGNLLHTVYLDAYNIDKYEVTNAQYAQFVAAGMDSPPASNSSRTRPSYYDNPVYANYPVINVRYHNARNYCNWLGKRLPSEAEWEKAARGTSLRPYPWGNGDPTCTLVNSANHDTDIVDYCVGDTSQVGSYPQGASQYGVMDMAGNVNEWVNDWYQWDYYGSYPPNAWPPNPSGPISGEDRIIRGGSWASYWDMLLVYWRGGPTYPYDYSTDLGFRCAVDIPGP